MVFEYDEIKAFISPKLKIQSDIVIYQKFKIPFMAPVFGVRGVELTQDRLPKRHIAIRTSEE